MIHRVVSAQQRVVPGMVRNGHPEAMLPASVQLGAGWRLLSPQNTRTSAHQTRQRLKTKQSRRCCLHQGKRPRARSSHTPLGSERRSRAGAGAVETAPRTRHSVVGWRGRGEGGGYTRLPLQCQCHRRREEAARGPTVKSGPSSPFFARARAPGDSRHTRHRAARTCPPRTNDEG
jgi:hypothetical protein